MTGESRAAFCAECHDKRQRLIRMVRHDGRRPLFGATRSVCKRCAARLSADGWRTARGETVAYTPPEQRWAAMRRESESRVLRVLGEIGEGGIGICDLARRADLHRSTVRRVLVRLLYGHRVQQLPCGTWRLFGA